MQYLSRLLSRQATTDTKYKSSFLCSHSLRSLREIFIQTATNNTF
jgi:hypothetical protein